MSATAYRAPDGDIVDLDIVAWWYATDLAEGLTDPDFHLSAWLGVNGWTEVHFDDDLEYLAAIGMLPGGVAA